MPQGRSGISGDTPDRLVFDAGELYLDIDISDLESTGVDDAISGATSLGATRGGATFNPNRTLRNMEVDGALGPVKGMVRREEVAPTLSVTLLEMSEDNLLEAIAGATSTTEGEFQKIVGGEIETATYKDNIALLATYSGDSDPVIFVLENVLATEISDVSLEDQNEPVLEVTFAGHFDPDDIDTEPWSIYHPGDA
jgi:hypothetical protein